MRNDVQCPVPVTKAILDILQETKLNGVQFRMQDRNFEAKGMVESQEEFAMIKATECHLKKKVAIMRSKTYEELQLWSERLRT